ncbi:MAG: tetratricopeptide (TPR) repeat protein [Kiritimatiellia bacterium]|jgi:tetratricopeptide (TPR) repeat protein
MLDDEPLRIPSLRIRTRSFMQFNPQTMPSPTGWIPGFRLSVSHWTHPETQLVSGRNFRTLGSIGELGPERSDVSWSLQLSLPDSFYGADVHMLCNGYAILPEAGPEEGTSADAGIFAQIPAAGILLIDAPLEVEPQLFCAEFDVVEEGTTAQIELEDLRIHLYHRVDDTQQRRLICLQILGKNQQLNAVKRALAYMEADIPEEVHEEFVKRAPFYQQQPAARNAVAAVVSLETLVGLLQAPNLRIPVRWQASRADESDFLFVNEMYAAVEVWCLLDVQVAKEIVRSILAGQRNNGGIASVINPSESDDDELCMWPVLAQLCRRITQADADPRFLSEVLPHIDEFLLYAYDYFNEVELDAPVWRSAEEAFIPETWDPKLIPVDLTVMLLCEVDEMLAFAQDIDTFEPDLRGYQTARTRLMELLSACWNPREKIYMDRLGGEAGGFASRISLGAYMPLLWNNLDEVPSNDLQKHLRAGRTLAVDDGMMLWQELEADEAPPSINALHQAFVYRILNRGPLADQQGAFLQRVQRSLDTHFAKGGSIPADLRLERNANGEILPPQIEVSEPEMVSCSLALLTRITSHQRSLSISEYPWIVRWLERRRVIVMTSAVLGMFLTVGAITFYFSSRKKMGSRQEYEAQGFAKGAYSFGQYDKAIEIYEGLVETSPKKGAIADYQYNIANAHFRNQNYKDAVEFYRLSIEKSPISLPQPKWNLTQALYRLGELELARVNNEEWIKEFGEHYPALMNQAELVRKILEDQITRRSRPAQPND